MNIFIKSRAFPHRDRLGFTLDFLFERTGYTWSWDPSPSDTPPILSWQIGGDGPHLDFPLADEWLYQDVLDQLPDGHLRRIDEQWWETFFFFLSMADRNVHEIYDDHGRWIPPQPDDFWPDRKRPYLDEAKEKFWEYFTRSTGHQITFSGDYSPVLSVDVDQWYAYSHKPLIRNIGGLIRDLYQGQLKRVADRLLVLFSMKNDPYDCLDTIRRLSESRNIDFEVFILPPVQSQWDRQVELPRKMIRQKLEKVSKVGLHPSYFVHEDEKLLADQKKWLEDILGRSVNSLRYHFIRGVFGPSQRLAIAHGFDTDKSHILVHGFGFPGGTCHPVRFWDHEMHKATTLVQVPQIAMDVSLKDYAGLTADVAMTEIKAMVQWCRKYKGTASIIWHNSSFNANEGWGEYTAQFSEILDVLRPDKQV